jgi:hypothetical protein
MNNELIKSIIEIINENELFKFKISKSLEEVSKINNEMSGEEIYSFIVKE